MASIPVEKLVARALAAALDEGLAHAEAVAGLLGVVEKEGLSTGHILEASFRCLEIGSGLPVCHRASELLDALESVLRFPPVLDGRSRFPRALHGDAREGPPSPAA